MEWARCETVSAGIADQPFDVLSALLGVAVGGWLLRRGHHLVGGALAGSSLASVAYHGTATGFAAWLDAVGVGLVALAFVADARRPTPVVTTAAVALVAGLMAVDGLRVGATGLIVVVAVAAVLTGHRLDRAWLSGATGLFAVGVGAWWVAANDTLCDADGWLPLHAAWHVCVVAGVGATAMARGSLATTA